MTLFGKVDPGTDVRETRRVRLRRIVRRTFYAKLSVAFALLLVVGVGYLRLVAGPVSLDDYSKGVGDALAERLGPGWRVQLSDTALQLQDMKPVVRAYGLSIRNPSGVLVVDAPYATVSLDSMSLVTGTLLPREVDLRDLQLRALMASDGTLSFVPPEPKSAAGEVRAEAQAASPPEPSVAETKDGEVKASPLSQAVASLLAPILKPGSVIGALERATVSGARLTLVGADGRERVAFGRVDALFDRGSENARRMNIELEGARGVWRIGGEVRDEADGRRVADLQASEVPLQDVMLLTGLSGLPAGSDLKLSGSLSASLKEGRLATMEGRFDSTPGVITRAGQPPLKIDRLSGGASWDEAARRLHLTEISAKSGETHVQLSGELAAGSDGAWQLKLRGRDTVVGGVTDRDPSFKVADLAAEVNFDERGISVDRLALKGDQLNVSIAGAATQGADGTGMRATVEARDTNVRRFLKLWPDKINPDLRNYLIDNLQSGTVSQMRLKTDLDPRDLKAAIADKPISDPALDLSFSLSNAKLSVMEGLPALGQLTVEGSASGTRTLLTSRGGRIDLPDGRRLNFSDGSYVQADMGKPGSMARIAFKLDGGADAVASLLRSPVLREAGALDIDPAAVKGRAEFKVTLPLDPKIIPKSAGDMSIVVAGTVSDLSADRVAGREKLEGANLTVAYDSGTLAVKGEGRLGGSPATFDLRQARGQPGEIVTNVMLDDAARLRRGLPSAPGVVGTVPVRVTTPFGPGAKPETRLEADLSRVAIDGLLPGWTKPAGRPGRVGFAMADGDQGELKDFVLESGPVQMRGHVAVGSDGMLDRADLATLKISQGDDLRAQLDRTGGAYRINLRGNVGDARPVLKWLNGPAAGGPKGKDPLDLEVDAAVNIVTGNNDEAMTGVVAKVATKGRDLRELKIRGQFRQATVDAQLIRRDGQPLLMVQSGDAGATLRFMDVYKRMIGGRLEVLTTPGDVQSGSISIDTFGLRNEPALKSLASPPVGINGSDDRASLQIKPLQSDQVDFTKLTAEFRRSTSRVDYKDVVIWGPQVGFNLQGWVDYARDRTDILGTFVPAYGLNNAFSQVPIVGLILGGDRNEGLFAIDFRVSGAASSPQLTVNPLTAVAPGILRKLFGWMMPEPETMATGTTAPRPAAPAARRPQRAN